MFGFPKTPRRIFKKNFLRSVIINIIYEPIVVTEFQDVIKTSLINYFPRFRSKVDSSFQIELRPNEKTPIVNAGEGVRGYQLLSEDGLSTISVDNTMIVVSIAGLSYKKFDDISEMIKRFHGLLRAMGITQIKRLSMRKLNVANFQTEDVFSVYEDLLNPVLAARAMAAMPFSESVLQNMTNVSLADGEYRLNLAYGIPSIPAITKPLKGIFVEDIDVIKESILPIDEMEEQLCKINQAIYDVFSWVNSDKLKETILGYDE
jgi:uncharacterized protein (TIGR04255 family)